MDIEVAGGEQHVEMRPPPKPDDRSRFFWDAAAAGKLVVQRCGVCGRLQYPPDIVCVFCQCQLLEVVEVTGRGIIYSFALVERAFHHGFVAHLPYVVALVELVEQEGLRMFANIVGCHSEEIAVGQPVEVIFERRDSVVLPQFRLTKAGQ